MILTVEREAWRDRAACRGISPEIFFPEHKGEDGTAKAVCGRCEARTACLEYALESHIFDGVYGGMDGWERERLLRRRARERSA